MTLFDLLVIRVFCIFSFYAPEGTLGGILKLHGLSVHYKWCLSHNSETAEANLMKLHRRIKHNEKVYHA